MRRSEEKEDTEKPARKMLVENDGNAFSIPPPVAAVDKTIESSETQPVSAMKEGTTIKKPQKRARTKLTMKPREETKHPRKQSGQTDDLRHRYLSDPSKYKEYKQLKYRNHIYKVGDAAFISNEDDAYNDFICKLLAIYRVDEEEKTHVFIDVQWFRLLRLVNDLSRVGSIRRVM